MPEEVVKLATAVNPQEAYLWKEALAEEGIEAQVVGDMLDVTFGDMPGVRPELWVHQADAERARAVLSTHADFRGRTADEDAEEEEEAPESAEGSESAET
jgi:hypothetical protein